MKRGKRFIEDNNIYIYMGTVIFFILAIALGIIMYMFSRKATKLENNEEQIAQEQQIEENTENVSTEIGKTVEEAEKDTNSNANITSTSSVVPSSDTIDIILFSSWFAISINVPPLLFI